MRLTRGQHRRLAMGARGSWFGPAVAVGVAVGIIFASATGVAEEVTPEETERAFLLRAGDLLGHDPFARLRSDLPPEAWPHRAELLASDDLAELERARRTPPAKARPCRSATVREVLRTASARARTRPARALGQPGFWKPGTKRIPDDARGTTIVLRGEASRALPSGEEIWIFVPERLNEAGRDTPRFASWSCLGVATVLAPAEAELDAAFGRAPGSDSLTRPARWQLRPAFVLGLSPPNGEPYEHAVFYIDQTTHRPLWAFGFEASGRLARVVLGPDRIVELAPSSGEDAAHEE